MKMYFWNTTQNTYPFHVFTTNIRISTWDSNKILLIQNRYKKILLTKCITDTIQRAYSMKTTTFTTRRNTNNYWTKYLLNHWEKIKAWRHRLTVLRQNALTACKVQNRIICIDVVCYLEIKCENFEMKRCLNVNFWH